MSSDGSGYVVDYAIETDEVLVSLRDNLREDRVTVYNEEGELGTYDLAGRSGPRALDTLSDGGLLDEEYSLGEDPHAENYSLKRILMFNVGPNSGEELMSELGVEDAEIENIDRAIAREDDPQTFQVVESISVPVEEDRGIEHPASGNDGPPVSDVEPRDEPLPDLDEQLRE